VIKFTPRLEHGGEEPRHNRKLPKREDQMRVRRCQSGINVFLLALGALLLGGAGGGSQAATQKTFVYVYDKNAFSRVFGFQLSPDGALTAVPGNHFDGDVGNTLFFGGNCEALAYSARRRLLFASSDNGVLVWSVAADGSLSLVPGSPFGSDSLYAGLRVVERGSR
jgi:hypothetical protein